MIKIVQKEDKALRQIAKEVVIKDIGTTKVRKVISDMKKALSSQDDGVAIAAPQIGVSLRIFVVSGGVMAFMKGELDAEGGGKLVKHKYPDLVFINPIITKKSKDRKSM